MKSVKSGRQACHVSSLACSSTVKIKAAFSPKRRLSADWLSLCSRRYIFFVRDTDIDLLLLPPPPLSGIILFLAYVISATRLDGGGRLRTENHEDSKGLWKTPINFIGEIAVFLALSQRKVAKMSHVTLPCAPAYSNNWRTAEWIFIKFDFEKWN